MKEAEFKSKLVAIDEAAAKEKNKVAREFAMSNNPHKVGDTISDSNITIKIELITWSWGYYGEVPRCVYKGLRLKKDNMPFKSEERETIYQKRVES